MNFLDAQISLLLSLLLSPLIVPLHIILIRFSQRGKVRLMMYAFFLYATLWFSLSWYAAEGFSLSWFISGGALAGFMALGYAECFSMVSRGFSLHILVDVCRRRSLTFEELLQGYGGRGMDWMLKKRIDTLSMLNMVKKHGDTLLLKKRGKFIGKAGIAVKKLLGLGEGG